MSPESPSAFPTVPEGYTPLERGGPYFRQLGAVYKRVAEGGGIVIGLRIDTPHTNIRGITHGGMLATLADAALGINLALARTPPQPMVTVNLSIDYLDAARPGDWLEAHVAVRKLGRRLAFAECTLQVGERRVLRASGVFTVVGKGAVQGREFDG